MGRIAMAHRTAIALALALSVLIGVSSRANAADALHVANVSRTLFSLPL
jgi:hypothetical protein